MAYANNTQEDLHTDANPEPEFHQDESTSGRGRGQYTSGQYANHTFVSPNLNVNIHCATNVIQGGNITVNNHYGRKRIKAKPKKAITNSNEKMTQIQKETLCKEIGADYKLIGLELGHTKGQLEQWRMEFSANRRELNHHILSQWEKKQDSEATRSALANILVKLKRGDLADHLAD